MRLEKWLIDFDILALLVAALSHDLDHPGVDNDFLIASKHELAERYNELSVLENYHSSILMRILSKSQFNIFEFFSEYKNTIKK